MAVDEPRWMSMLRLRATAYVLACMAALFCVVVIDAISFTLAGVRLDDMTFDHWTSGAFNPGLIHAFWSEFFIQQIRRVPRLAEDASPNRIVVEHCGDLVGLDALSIDAVEAAGDYMEIRCGERTFLDRQTLGTLADRLGPAFVRVHHCTRRPTRRRSRLRSAGTTSGRSKACCILSAAASGTSIRASN